MKNDQDALKDKKVLLVEDEVSTAELFSRFLRRSGLRPMWAENADEALKLLENNTFDMIISDIEMPDTDGLNFCRKVRQDPKNSEILFLFVTVRKQLRQRVEGLGVGADGYLVKPIHLSELLTVMLSLFRMKDRFVGPEGEESSVSPSPVITVDYPGTEDIDEGQDEDTGENEILRSGKGALLKKDYMEALKIFGSELARNPDDKKAKSYYEKAQEEFEEEVFHYLKSERHIPVLTRKNLTDYKASYHLKMLGKQGWEIYSLIDGEASVKKVISKSSLERLQALNILYRLALEKLIRIKKPVN